MKKPKGKAREFFRSSPGVIVCVGPQLFEDALRDQGAEVIPVEWRPPHIQSREIKDLLNQLL